ncbi:MAG: MSHA biogenesis protein MshK [Telluria sp.]
MDQAVMTPAARALLLLLVVWTGAPLRAQALADPTRPPAVLAPAVPGTSALPAEPAEPQLQSVLISVRDGGRRVAVIDGQALRLGEKFRDAVLIRITETEVVLRRGRALQVLRLFPAAELKAAPGGVQRRP